MMTRRQWIEVIHRRWPTMRLSSIKAMVRQSMDEENPIERDARIRRDEGEWAVRMEVS